MSIVEIKLAPEHKILKLFHTAGMLSLQHKKNIRMPCLFVFNFFFNFASFLILLLDSSFSFHHLFSHFSLFI